VNELYITHLIMESTSLNSASNPNRLRAWLISSTVIIESPFLSNMSKIRLRRSELRLWLRSRKDFDGDDRFISPITLELVRAVMNEGIEKLWELEESGYCFVQLCLLQIKWKNLNTTNKPCSYVTQMNGS